MIISIYIKKADKRYHKVFERKYLTREQAVKIILQFRKARRVIPNWSRGLFGGGYPIGTLRWIATHSGLIEIRGGKRHRRELIKFTNPCNRRIRKFIE